MTDATVIFINGNKQLSESASSGQGTPDNPYVIDGVEIRHTTSMDNTKLPSVGIYIMNTDKHAVIKNCKFIGLPKQFVGSKFDYVSVYISNSKNITITDNVFYGFHTQISAVDVDNVIIANNLFVDGYVCVECALAYKQQYNHNIHVVNNIVYNNFSGISLGKIIHANVSHNVLLRPVEIDSHVSYTYAISITTCQHVMVANNTILGKFDHDLAFDTCQNLIVFRNSLGPNVGEEASMLLNNCYMTSVLHNLFAVCKGIVDIEAVVNLDFLLNFGAYNGEGLKLPTSLLGFSKFCDNVFV